MESAWWMGSDVNSYVEFSGCLACSRVSSTRTAGEAPASGEVEKDVNQGDAWRVWVLAVKILKHGGLPFGMIWGA